MASVYTRVLLAIEKRLNLLPPEHQAHMLRYLHDVYITRATVPPDEKEAHRRRMERTRAGTGDGTSDGANGGSGGRTSAKRDSSSKTSPEVTALLGDYEKYFQERYSAKPHIVRPKDPAIVASLVRRYGADKVAELLDSFFKTDDEFVLKSGHTIGVFSSQINKLLAARSPARTRPKSSTVGLLNLP